MANSFSAALVTDVIEDTALTVLQNKLASLKSFSSDFSTDEIKPKATIQVPLITAGAAATVDPTNYESGDTAIGNVPVVPHEISVSFGITNAQLNQGFRLKQIANIQLIMLANAVMDAAMTPITVANYGAAVVAGVSAANFGPDDLSVLFAAAKNFNTKNLVLDGSYLAQFIPTDKLKFKLGEDGAFGFDLIAENNRFTAADAKVQGFVADPQALAVASGLSIIDDAVAKNMLVNEVITLDALGGLAVRFNVWGSLSTRNVWGSFGLMFGAAKGDGSALKLITSP